MKKILLLVLACGIFISSFSQKYSTVAAVIIVDAAKKKVYARTIPDGKVFQFLIKDDDVKKFSAGKEMFATFDTDKVSIAEGPVIVSGLEIPLLRAADFRYQVAGIQAASMPKETNVLTSGITAPAEVVIMLTRPLRNNSNMARACCYESNSQGIEFNLPNGMIDEDLKREVYPIGDIVLVDKREQTNSPIRCFSITGVWADTTSNTNGVDGGAVKTGVELGKNIKARPNTSETEKWKVTPIPTMKGVLGRLDINFPQDVERNILIHQQADNKFITSVSRNDKTYTIAPGEYHFVLSSVPVENVPIQKGHETRLKAGFLNVVSEGDWHLYDDTKEKAYTSGNKPKKIPLPVGNYQLKLGGQYYPVIIKDREIVEF